MRGKGRFLWALVVISLLMAPLGAAESGDHDRGGGSGTHDDAYYGEPDKHEDPYYDESSRHQDPYYGEPAEARDAKSEPYHEGKDPCAQIWADYDTEVAAMYDRHDAEWRKHDAKWRQHYAKDNRTQEEDKAFGERMEAEERAMHARQQQEARDLERRASDACDERIRQEHRQQRAATQHPDDPCADLHAANEAKWEEMDKRHRQEWRQLEDENHAFYASNHSQEEAEAFEARMQQKQQAMQERHERERREAETPDTECRERMRAKEREHQQQRMREERHMRAREYREMSPEMQASMREMEELRMECEARGMARADAFESEMDAKWRAFEESGRTDHEAFEREMMEHRRAFEREMMELRDTCDQKMRAYYEDNMGRHMEHGDQYERMGSWRMEESADGVFLHGKYMSLAGDPSTNTIGDITVSGQVYIGHIDTTGFLEDFEMDEDHGGSTLTAYGEGLRMRLHDNPGGVINFKADGESFLLTIPSTFEVQETQNGWAWSNGEHRATLRAGDARWNESARTLEVSGQATFLLPGSSDNKVLPKVANKHRGDILDAVESKRLGAEITVAGRPGERALDDTVVYDDVEVQVETPEDGTKPVAITVSADHTENGKTFVLNLDQDIYDLRADLDVTYFDIDEATGAETPARIEKASSIADILDPSDDDAAEYWIVLDEDGVQVLVSVPSWSTHRFKVQGSEPADESSPFEHIPAPGLALVALALVGAAAVVARRRP